MVKKENTRIIITLSKKQAEWLKMTAKECHTSVSKLIKWLMDKNIARLARTWREEDIDKLIRIVKTPWIVQFDDDENDDLDEKEYF